MKYLYGEFSDNQIKNTEKQMHNEIHKLLLHKAEDFNKVLFLSDSDFMAYFNNLLFRFGGLNKLLGEPNTMVSLMATLQAAYDYVQSDHYNFKTYRKAILDSHDYIDSMFKEVFDNAKSFNS